MSARPVARDAGGASTSGEGRWGTMSEDSSENSTSLTVPIGALGALLVLGIAGAAYAYLQRGGDESPQGFVQSAVQRAKPGKNTRRKVGLMALIALIDNDASRKVLLTFLRALQKRS